MNLRDSRLSAIAQQLLLQVQLKVEVHEGVQISIANNIDALPELITTARRSTRKPIKKVFGNLVLSLSDDDRQLLRNTYGCGTLPALKKNKISVLASLNKLRRSA